MKQREKIKIILAWIILIISIVSLLALHYIKFFGVENPNIEETPVENSTSEAIHTALKDIVNNFNSSEQVKEYAEQNIVLKATLNQYSIYISYITDVTITYEFSYSNLNLAITVENEQVNLECFYQVYRTLTYAVQKRIGNEENIDQLVLDFFNSDKSLDGMIKEESDQTIYYQMDITKKIVNESVSE